MRTRLSIDFEIDDDYVIRNRLCDLDIEAEFKAAAELVKETVSVQANPDAIKVTDVTIRSMP